MSYVMEKLEKLKAVEGDLLKASTEEKNKALNIVADTMEDHKDRILAANKKDLEEARKVNMNSALVDRLMLDEERLGGIIKGVRDVAKLPDPVWESNKTWTLENGLTIAKMSVPLGVVGIIYESRPNVTADAFALAFKSGNGIILRGSSSAINSNMALVEAIREGLEKTSISKESIQFFEDTNRDHVKTLLEAKGYVDLLIPRGGKGLINFVLDNAKVPTLQTGEGNCHVFIDETGKLDDGVKIVVNAKTQRTGVCNACETLLVHEKVAGEFLPKLYEEIKDEVEIFGDEIVRKYINVKEASEEDWATEYLDSKLAIRVVGSVDEAIDHINKYGTRHSESIVSQDYTNIKKFTKLVDASTVYANASTRFTDGSEFGFGAEMGISTQKTHARGPVGLEQLVTYKYIVLGEGHIRK